MSLFQTSCRLCRDFRDDLNCAAGAFVIFAQIAVVTIAILGFIGVMLWASIDQEKIWPIPTLFALFFYWCIYRDQC